MVWIQDQIVDAVTSVLADVRDGILDLTTQLFETLLGPIVGVPAPEAADGFVVTGAPANHPWNDLYSQFYLTYTLGLTFGLAFLGFAFLGLRAESMSHYKRKRILRRLLLVTLGSLVWFPFVSVLLQFVDSVGIAIAPIDEMGADFSAMTRSAVGGVFAGLLMAVVSNVMLLVAALGFALRYLSVVVLTLTMPLLGVFWALDTWPLNATAEIARKASGVYPGLVLAGLPAAVLFRIGFLWDIFGDDPGLWDLVLALMFIPTASVASLMVVYWSAPAVKTIAQGGGRSAAASPARLRRQRERTKAVAGTAVRGGRNVHRGFSNDAHGAVTGSSQTTLGSGGSSAYKLGEAVANAGDRARGSVRRYRPSGGTTGRRVTDRASADVVRLGSGLKEVSKRGLQRTKRKISRW